MDIQLLGSMLNRKAYELLEPSVPKDLVSAYTVNIMRWLGAYYKANPKVDSLTPNDLKAYVRLRSTRAAPEQLELTLAVIDKLRSGVDHTPTLLGTLNELSLAGRVGAVLERYANGDEVDVVESIREFLYEADTIAGSLGSGVDTTSVSDLLEAMENEGGVKLLGLPRFEEQIGPLRLGDSIAFAGRPGIGKTSCIARIVNDTARGLAEFAGYDRPILWLINEGDVSAVRTRIIQAGPKLTVSELFEKNRDGTLPEYYHEKVGVPIDYIRAAPIYGWSTVQIERLIEKENPALVVTDMLEHVNIAGSESKTERINDLWVWTREAALRHGHISLATTQVGSDGANLLFPDIAHLHYSRTGIQSSTDLVIMLGADEGRVGMETLRGVSTPKNKRKVEGQNHVIRTEVEFDMDRCDFT